MADWWGCGCARNETKPVSVLRGALVKAVEQTAEQRVGMLLDAKANVNETDKVAANATEPCLNRDTGWKHGLAQGSAQPQERLEAKALPQYTAGPTRGQREPIAAKQGHCGTAWRAWLL